MMGTVRIPLATRYGRSLMSATEGEDLHGAIVSALRGDSEVVLDFENVDVLVSAFLNPAVGLLYRDFEPGFLNSRLKFEHCSHVQSRTISEVLKNAKEHILGGKDIEAQREALRKMFPE